jgi:pyruvate dehydrogenase E2 component (dihydrolipoamide acetyltransferase)
MPAYVTMPQLSDTMSEGVVAKWVKNEGEAVKQGQTIAEVETDKATMEMEVFDAGTLAQILVKAGEAAAVGMPIAVLAVGKESIEDARKWHAQQGAAAAKSAPAAKPISHSVAAGEGDSGEPSQGDAHAPTATATMAAPPAAQQPVKTDNGNRRVRVSPLARRVAAEKGIDVAQLLGSGPGGRVVQRDVLDSIQSGGTPAKVAPGKNEIIPLTKMRLTIAKRLAASKQNIPHFYETVDVDVEDLTNLRVGLNKRLEAQKIRVSLGDLITKAVTMALLDHPALNASFDGTQVTRFGDVHLGMAVAIPDGLIVPVLKNAHRLSIREIRQRSVDLAERARAQRLKQDEMTGATFTVSNLGAYGLKEFSAIINPPEVAILAVGAAQRRPTVHGEAIVARTMMTLTLSADHRVVDGATAAEFLRTLKSILEEPGAMLA